jgi:hypothetical protein
VKCRDQIIEIAKRRTLYLDMASCRRTLVLQEPLLIIVGPSPEVIEAFGLKNTDRELATKAGAYCFRIARVSNKWR